MPRKIPQKGVSSRFLRFCSPRPRFALNRCPDPGQGRRPFNHTKRELTPFSASATCLHASGMCSHPCHEAGGFPVRWCRSFLAQPPATCLHASGMCSHPCHEAGGFPDCSRWLSPRQRATPPVTRPRKNRTPAGVPAYAILRNPLASLRDAGLDTSEARWCRSFLAQPPATCFHASGMRSRPCHEAGGFPVRWCRSFLAQPPATCLHASGMRSRPCHEAGGFPPGGVARSSLNLRLHAFMPPACAPARVTKPEASRSGGVARSSLNLRLHAFMPPACAPARVTKPEASQIVAGG
jgi:hypothetical protein